MSRFFSDKYQALTPYTPGEQPRERRYIKLNTNESPFPPSLRAQAAANEAAAGLHLYSDPTARALNAAMADLLGVDPDEILFTNGSDEILNFAFGAFCDEHCPAVFPDITYGFYTVFAEYNRVPYVTVPLREDLTIDPADYYGGGHTVFIANPNAPTGIPLTRGQIEEIVKHNPDNVVVVDEAYVDFGAESAVPLIRKYDNLLVTQTFSKSRSMAGARLGFGVGCRSLIRDLNTLKYATNPYNVNAMTMAAGIGTLADEAYTRANCRTVAQTREYTVEKLQAMGFLLTDSMANFVFARHPRIDGGEIYRRLKERGILVRHFDTPRIRQFNRITIGTRDEMDALLAALQNISEELL